MSTTRQLAAIMFTDMVGYTALMNADEARALDLRNKHRQVFEHTTSAFHGTIVQYFGDGTLSVFNSTVEAVECAIEMQTSFLHEGIPVRIGIHVGDILQQEDDIIGDAVNVASRIESCAIAGSVLISDKVHDQIRSHRHIETKFMDAFEFKNVEGKMPIYAVSNVPLELPDPKHIMGKLKEPGPGEYVRKRNRQKTILGLIALVFLAAVVVYTQWYQGFDRPEELSIAVLPFDNLTQTDADSELFRDGIADDILTQLAKLQELRVIGRKSTSRYLDTDKSISQIAKELDVSLILEGSIRRLGNQLRVSVHLINAENEEQLWASNYDRTLTDIFAMQSEIAGDIANSLQLELSSNEAESIAAIPTQNIEAYKLFLLGRKEADKRDAASLEKSIQYYEQAVALDPNYAEALAEIANSVYLQTYYSGRDPIEAAITANDYLDRAEALDDKLVRVYSVKGLISNIQGDYQGARSAFEKAIVLSPNDVDTRRQYATFFLYNGQYKEQLEQAAIAYRLDPLSFPSANAYFAALVENYQFEAAELLMKQVQKDNVENNPFVINRNFFRLYTAMEDYQKVIEPLEALSKEEYAFYRYLAFSYAQLGDTAKVREVIQRIDALDIDERTEKNHMKAMAYAAINQKDSAFYLLDTIRNSRSGLLIRERKQFFKNLHDDPRYPGLLSAHGIDLD